MYKAVRILKDIFYPNKCMLCRDILDKNQLGLLCDKCYPKVLRNHLCIKCGRPYHLGKEDCLFCKKEKLRSINRIIALFPYKERCREAVLRWKYRGIRKYAIGYADLFVNDLCIIEKLKVDALIPVPLSPHREQKRGFNQSLDLAEEINKLTDIPVYDLLMREKDTKPQSKCSKEERRTNIKGSISLKRQECYPLLKRIAIIDDIYTTGATIEECIKVIRQELSIRNEEVYLLVVCIGV